MKKLIATVLGALLTCSALTANAVWDITPEGLVGSTYGTAAACKEIMPDAVRLGLTEMNRRFEGFGINLSQVVERDDYKKAFSEEVERIRALTAEERFSACQWVFGRWQVQGKQKDTKAGSLPTAEPRG